MMIPEYMRLFFCVVAAAVVLFAVLAFSRRGKGLARQVAYLLCFLSFFTVVFATVIMFNLPFDFAPNRHVVNFQPLRWLGEGEIRWRLKEIALNILLFMPLGVFAPMAFKRLRRFGAAVLGIFAVTFCIEFFQYFIGRSADIDDIIANLLGGIIGYAVFKISSKLFGRGRF